MLNTVWSVVTAGLGLASIAALAWWAGRPNRARETESAARDHFDAHGRWPEEDA
jgi:hypothetical protein